MGFPMANTEGSRELTDSPECIWICPTFLRGKGKKAIESISVISREFKAAAGPFRMSFVSFNHTAYDVLKNLKNTSPVTGVKVSGHPSHPHLLPPCSAPQNPQGAVIVYHRRVYLSMKKRTQNQSQPCPASFSPIPSTSEVSPKSQKVT